MNVSYLVRNRQSDLLRCPECAHTFSGYTKSRRKRVVSYSCPRLISSVLRRKLSIFRTIYSPKRIDDPVLCDHCKCKVTKYNGLGVKPFSERGTPRREVKTSSYRNLMRDYYSALFEHHIFEVMHSKEQLTDTGSEHFIKSTDYSIRKIEDDLKQQLLKELFKPRNKIRHHTNSPRPTSSSHKVRMLFSNGTPDFNELKRGSSDSGLIFPLEGNVRTTSSIQTMTNQPCCDFKLSKIDNNWGSERLKANLLVKKSVTSINNHQESMGTQYSITALRKNKKKWRKRSVQNDISVLKNMTFEKDIQVQLTKQPCCKFHVQNEKRSLLAPSLSNIPDKTVQSDVLLNNSNFTNSNSKLLKQLKPNAHQSNMETQYNIISHKKKKKGRRRSISIVKEEHVLKDVMYGRDIQVQTAFPKKQKELQVDPYRATWDIKKKSTKSERLQTILETPQNSCPQPQEVIGQPVMCINPSCFFVNGCLFITRENTGTQYEVKCKREATMTEDFLKTQPRICEKNCQSQTEKLLNAPQKHSVIVQCHQQVNKFIQSACNHNPPCEMVPECFRMKYL